MAGKLVRVVHLRDAEGRPVTFLPGDEIPGWAQRAITNPDAWDDTPSDADTPPPPGSATRPAVATPVPREPFSGPPPLSGRGSSVARWREYAAEQGVQVSADTERDDIIGELRTRGVPVE